MTITRSPKKLAFLLLTSLFLFLHFSSSHPTSPSGGYTGAPGDQVCLNCHNTGSLNGNVQLSGIPASIDPGTTYPITVTVNNTVGAAVRAGFQIVTLRTATNTNSGSYSIPTSEANAVVKSASGKSYAGHQTAKSFVANTLSYDIEWTAPTNQDGEEIKFYAAALIGNGSGTAGDRFVTTNVTSTIIGGGGSPLDFTFTNIGAVSCNGENDGTATAEATGGSGTYMYAWDNGETNATATMLSAGPHNVTVSDTNAGSKVGTVDIPDAPVIVAGIVFEANVSCFGSNDGQAEVQATGGTGTLSYDWGAGITGPLQTALFAGSYTVTITDDNNCEALVSLDIEEPQLLQISTTNLTEPTCSDSEDGSITIVVNGGILPYEINWTPNIGTQSGGTLSDIPAGQYTVDVLDANQCLTSSTLTLSGPEPISIMFNDVVNESCVGANDGSAMVQGSGGTGTLTYNWSNGSTAQSVFDLSPGNYSVTATDQEGCTHVGDIDIMAGGEVEVALTITNQPSCGNMQGAILANVVQITGTPSFLWSNGVVDDDLISGLSAGTYSVTVTDQNGCSDTASIMLQEQNDIQASVSLTTDVSCNGGSDGSASLSATGGQSPYQFLWPDAVISMQRLDLAAGNYMVTVSDQAGCIAIVDVEISEPTAIAVTTSSIMPAGCFATPQGSIALTAEGGTGTLTYLWNTNATTSSISGLTGGTYSCTITDDNDCTVEIIEEVLTGSDLAVEATFQNPICSDEATGSITLMTSSSVGITSIQWSDGSDSGSSRNGLSAGTYGYIVTDSLGCISEDSITIVAPLTLENNLTTSDETGEGLSDGAASVAPSGGTAPYQVQWSTGEVSLSIVGLAPGMYSVIVLDSNGCQLENSFMISSFGCDLIATTTQTNNICSNDSLANATVIPSQGTPPYSIAWSTGDSTDVIDNLPSGIYTVTISDLAGCTISLPVTISQPFPLVLNATITLPTIGQSNGAIDMAVSGGVSPYEYEWNSGDTTNIIQNLDVGIYSVTVTDANGCTATNSIDLQVAPCINELVVLEQSPFACFGRSESTITVGLSISDTTATYLWQDGSTSATLDSIPGGNYAVTVTTADGCEYSLETAIVENSEIVAEDPFISNESLVGAADGSIVPNQISGGTAPYTYQWFDESNTVISIEEQLTGASAGTYFLCVTDSLLCNGLFGPYEISVSTAILEPTAEYIEIYPNPTSADVLVSAQGEEIMAIELFDMQGKSHYAHKDIAASSVKIVSANLAIGVYLLQIKTKTGVFTKQLQVIK